MKSILQPETRVAPDQSTMEFVFRRPSPSMLGQCALSMLLAAIAGGSGFVIALNGGPAWLGWCLLGIAFLGLVGSLSFFAVSTLAVDPAKVCLDQKSLTVTMYQNEIAFTRSDVIGLRVEEGMKGRNAGYLVITRHGSMRVLLDQAEFDLARMHETLVRELGLSDISPVTPVVGWRTVVGPVRWLGLIAAASIAVSTGYCFWADQLAAAETASWSATQGVVLSSEAGSRDRTYYAHIRYRYSVQDKAFESDRISFTHTASDIGVRSLAGSHPAGSQITVYYDPEVPSEATLLKGVSPFIWLALVSSISGAGFAIALVIWWPAAGSAGFLARYPGRRITGSLGGSASRVQQMSASDILKNRNQRPSR